MLSWGSQYDLDKSPYWVLSGQTECSYLLQDNLRCLELIFKSIYFDFPRKGRFARKAVIGDCCPESRQENCQGHPDRSHMGGGCLDMNYFTWKSSNFTQGGPFDPRVEKVDMWDFDVLRSGFFDDVRNWALFKRIKEVFPQASFMIDEELRGHMRGNLRGHRNVNSSGFETVVRGPGDPPVRRKVYKHHLHTHISLGSKINWDLEIKWRKGVP